MNARSSVVRQGQKGTATVTLKTGADFVPWRPEADLPTQEAAHSSEVTEGEMRGIRAAKSTVPVLVMAHVLIAAPQPAPTFDVTSVKPSLNPRSTQIGFPPGGFVAVYTPLRPVISLIYGEDPETEVIGGPAWLDFDPFDIEAKAEGSPSAANLKIMTRALLEDRFKLKVHHEQREAPVYALTTGPAGETGRQLRVHVEGDCATDRRLVTPTLPICGFGLPVIGEREVVLRGRDVTMSQIARNLKAFAGRPVLDRTGVSGRFSFELTVAREAPTGVGGGSIAPGVSATLLGDALREQLGLTLESARAPVDVVVIDSVQRPTAN